MNPIKAGLSVIKKAAPDILNNISTGLFITSSLSQGKQERKAKQEMREQQKIDEIRANVSQKQADLIGKIY